jgi:uncharacterized membrane protein YedE/YeeE
MQRKENNMTVLLAILLGTAFGFGIHRVGASNPSGIINMLRLKDMHLMRVIFLAIAVSSTLIFLAMTLGIMDASQLSVKSMTWGVIVGGMVLGIGWGIGGYCPCTSICALGEGRKDAIFFVLGGLGGALLYMLIFDYISGTFLLDPLLGGKAILADMTPSNEVAIVSGVPALATALVIAVIFTTIAYFLPTSSEPEAL